MYTPWSWNPTKHFSDSFPSHLIGRKYVTVRPCVPNADNFKIAYFVSRIRVDAGPQTILESGFRKTRFRFRWADLLVSCGRKKYTPFQKYPVSCWRGLSLRNCISVFHETDIVKPRCTETRLIRTPQTDSLFFPRRKYTTSSPHFSSGIVERAKPERAWKSTHARKGRRVSPFVA